MNQSGQVFVTGLTPYSTATIELRPFLGPERWRDQNLPGGEKGSESASEDAAQARLGPNDRVFRLEGFSLEVLDAMAADHGGRPEAALEAAVRRYLADRTLRPPGWRCLQLPERQAGLWEGANSVTITLDEETLGDLDNEAAAQQVSCTALAAHALMYAWSAERAAAPEEATAASGRGRSGGPGGDDGSGAQFLQ